MAIPPKKNPSTASASVGEKGDCPACRATNVPLKEVSGMKICAKCASKRFSSKVRKSIEDAFSRQQDQIQRESWKKRLAIAKRAMDLYEEQKYPEALKIFREYITILETRYKCPPGGLSPHVFTTQAEEGEILLLAGIYWDMAKIYDRMKGRQVDLRSALNKFVEFSIGKPHLILASEAVRRYLASGRCLQKDDFSRTHRVLRSRLAKCFIASAVFGPSSPEVKVLRRFRDRHLVTNPPGRFIVKTYYRLSPPIAARLAKTPAAASLTRAVLRPVTRILKQFS